MKKQNRISSCVAILPYSKETHEAAIRIGTLAAWGKPTNFWQQRSIIKVKFIGGSTRQQKEARIRFELIDSLINLSFQFVTTGDSDIRVDFNLNNGHWSYVGKGCRNVSKNKATMNLALRAGFGGDSTDEWDRVAIHEVLHAIGLEHEHQSPRANKIIWNKDAVYKYYRSTQGWSKQEIDFQVLNRANVGNDFIGTDFDANSIMEYPVPQGLANIVIGWNRSLTKSDINVIQTIYPSNKVA